MKGHGQYLQFMMWPAVQFQLFKANAPRCIHDVNFDHSEVFCLKQFAWYERVIPRPRMHATATYYFVIMLLAYLAFPEIHSYEIHLLRRYTDTVKLNFHDVSLPAWYRCNKHNAGKLANVYINFETNMLRMNTSCILILL